MEDLNLSARIAVSMVIVGIILSVYMTVSAVTTSFSRAQTDSIISDTTYAYNQDLSTMDQYNNPIPVASIFVTLNRNSDMVHSISGTVNGTSVSKLNDLTKLFSSKARVHIVPVGDNVFNVVLSDS